MKDVEFPVGKEKDFLKFINNISSKDRIASISHTDCDGLSAAKIIDSSMKIDYRRFVNYDEMNDDLIKDLKSKKITKIIITDLGVDDISFIDKLEEFAEILMIDHHLFEKDFNSDKTIFFNAQGYCATFLTYVLFSKIKDIEILDWLVACASIADYMYFKNQSFMKKTFKKYGEEFSIGKIMENKFWDVQYNISLGLIYLGDSLDKAYSYIGKEFGDIGHLEDHGKEVIKEIDLQAANFDKNKEIYGDVYLFEIKPKFPVKSIVGSILSKREINKTFLIISKDGNHFFISSRRQDKKVNLKEFLEKLLEGFEDSNSGGHKAAAGGYFLVKDLKKFKERLEKLS